MNKSELIANVAKRTGTPLNTVSEVVNATFEAIGDALANEGKVSITGFGNFEARERAARIGRNPQTKETIEIPATRVPGFKAGKLLKDRLR